MSTAILIFFVLLILLVLIGTPVSFSIIVSTTIYLFASGQDPSIAAEQLLNAIFSNYLLLAVPLFIMSANIMNVSNITDKLLQFCLSVVGRFRGGLGHVNVVLSLIFSGMSGSAIADVAGIGKIIIPMMTANNKYTRGYAAAITAASATIGPIIPPSIPIVLYALVSNASIGYLFLAGIIPGIFMGILLMIANAYLAKKKEFPIESPVPLREIPKRTIHAFPSLLLPFILLYGIYGGVMTPTEAAAVAALYALLIAKFFYRSLSLKGFYQAMNDSARSSASAGLIVGSALIMNYIIVTENIPSAISSLLENVSEYPILFLLSLNLLVLLLGCVLDATVIILVIVPLFLPTIALLGIDPVYFGVIIVVNCMIGLITPPYGVIILVIQAVMKIPINEIIREIWPFLFTLILSLIVMIIYPDLVLWLPRVFGYEG